MRKAFIGSLVFHVVVTVAVFQWVAFNQVTYVRRDVYSVNLVSASAAQAAVKMTPPPPAPKKAEPVEEKEEDKKDDQMPAPPTEKKKESKKAEKKDDKVVPTADIRKTDAKPDSALAGAEGGAGGEPGPAVGAVSIDGGDFPFASFVTRMRQKIAAAWEVPAGTVGVERTALVYFRAHRDGSVSHVTIEKSSDLPLFDRSCQRAVMEAAPLPPLPREYRDEFVGVHLPFTYTPME